MNKQVRTQFEKIEEGFEKNINTVELFEFLGSISKTLTRLLKEKEASKEKKRLLLMLKNWNEKTVKTNPLLLSVKCMKI